jgi:hypothetical protein
MIFAYTPPMESRRRRFPRIALSFGALFVLLSSSGYAGPQLPDSWEARPPPCPGPWKQIDEVLIVPVPKEHRPEAIAKLQNTSAVPLGARDASALLDLPADSAPERTRVLEAIVQKLDAQRRCKPCDVGPWTPEDQQHLDHLKAVASKPFSAGLRPFLVRAVARNEVTAGFRAATCGDSLVIFWGGLGHSTPPSIRIPVVLFLQHAPKKVYVEWAMAE